MLPTALCVEVPERAAAPLAAVAVVVARPDPAPGAVLVVAPGVPGVVVKSAPPDVPPGGVLVFLVPEAPLVPGAPLVPETPLDTVPVVCALRLLVASPVPPEPPVDKVGVGV